MKKFTLLAVALFSSVGIAQAQAEKSDMVTTLKIQAWGGNQPAWDITGNRRCIKNINYTSSAEAKWQNIGTPSEAPRYNFEVTHTPACNATITFHWDGSPNDNDHRSDSFARVEMGQYR
ncbi:hypothetical protein [Candidatus Odyssella acanthamoebae]|uniref:Uncharacterized protein n=1 Tax=Candidatus Odyssella acanthamoebae TaxID=91604 RepID=A0A077AYF9_9PROT|nr:hypothetical protein [Candidatus Paracaedibacter acanthamoebae]AIK96668.1 hypothetical protein ID47_07965 [Candidatus Paracaedibacter acanthamoebae]